MKVVVCLVGKKPEVREIENTLAAYQAIVGERPEHVESPGAFRVYADEKRAALPHNRGAFHGPILVTGPADENGADTSLTDEEAASFVRTLTEMAS